MRFFDRTEEVAQNSDNGMNRTITKGMDFEDRGLMTEAGRQAFEKSFEYEIVS